MTFHNWFLIYQGNGSLGNGMRDGLHGSEVRGSPYVTINVHVLTKFA